MGNQMFDFRLQTFIYCIRKYVLAREIFGNQILVNNTSLHMYIYLYKNTISGLSTVYCKSFMVKSFEVFANRSVIAKFLQ